jgi:FkbM family methyltransferase
MMISYAQNFEDVMLARAFKGQSAGFYVDVGTWHATDDSVTKHFYDLGWSGINIEPVLESFLAIRTARARDININAAVGTSEKPVELYVVNETGLSTSNRNYASSHKKSGFVVAPTIVPSISLRSICQEHARSKTIDFMKIDVEGAEADVIASADWHQYRPRIVVVEATVPRSPEDAYAEWEPQLTGAAYKHCYSDGLNRWYVREEDEHLATAFRFPPNVFDEFQTHGLAKSSEALMEARKEIELLRSSAPIRSWALRIARKIASASRP